MTTFTATTARATLFAEVTRLQGIEREPGLAREAQRLAASIAAASPATKTVARSSQTVIRDDIECPKCLGTGVFGQGYKCYPCEGKGIQTDADQRRNWGYKANHTHVYGKEVNNVNPRSQYQPPAPTAEQLAHRARMAAAKAAAIATGSVVMV